MYPEQTPSSTPTQAVTLQNVLFSSIPAKYDPKVDQKSKHIYDFLNITPEQFAMLPDVMFTIQMITDTRSPNVGKLKFKYLTSPKNKHEAFDLQTSRDNVIPDNLLQGLNITTPLAQVKVLFMQALAQFPQGFFGIRITHFGDFLTIKVAGHEKPFFVFNKTAIQTNPFGDPNYYIRRGSSVNATFNTAPNKRKPGEYYITLELSSNMTADELFQEKGSAAYGNTDYYVPQGTEATPQQPATMGYNATNMGTENYATAYPQNGLGAGATNGAMNQAVPQQTAYNPTQGQYTTTYPQNGLGAGAMNGAMNQAVPQQMTYNPAQGMGMDIQPEDLPF